MSAMADALSLLLLPFAACVAFVLIHAYLGVHVLRRKIVFADLALAQFSALGAAFGFALGHAPTSPAGFGYALLFTVAGAGLMALTRGLARCMSQEAFVGIVYVVATAATILVVDRSPQGAEHVKRILIGSILTVQAPELAKLVALYAAVGLFHWWLRRPLLAIASEAQPAGRSPLIVLIWDLLFFLSFAVVVTSSVTTAGVLLVFSFLIVPAVIGSIFSSKLSVVLPIAWGTGILASAAGLAGSYALDLPTGAALVAAFAFALVLAGLAKAFIFAGADSRNASLRSAARAAAAIALVITLASSFWLMINPTAEQPLAAVLERVFGIGPVRFLSTNERTVYADAVRDTGRFQAELDALNAKERAARYQAIPLSDDDIRRVASYQQNFNEMSRGERFVQEVLRGKAQERERWIVGIPASILALAGLLLLGRPMIARRR
jgi:zinc/manganese transport system permease protein